jgi:hypothetical protein
MYNNQDKTGGIIVNNPRSEDKLAWIVAFIGIIIFIVLSYATMVMWDLANPVPKTPDSTIIPEKPEILQTETNTVPSGDPHHNVTEMYLAGHREDLRMFPQNISDPYEANYVPLETARMHATVELARMMFTEGFGRGVVDFNGSVMDPDPVIVFDEITGKRTTYEFFTVTPHKQGAYVIIVASKYLGFSAPQAGLGSVESNAILLQKAQGYYTANYSGFTISSVKFVSGCWGKIVQMHLSDPKRPGEIIVNMDYWGIVKERRCGASTEDISKKDVPKRIAAWEESDAMFRGIMAKAQSENINLSEPFSQDTVEKVKPIFESGRSL